MNKNDIRLLTCNNLYVAAAKRGKVLVSPKGRESGVIFFKPVIEVTQAIVNKLNFALKTSQRLDTNRIVLNGC